MPATRPLSQLIHLPVQPGTDGAAIITLHDHNAFAKDAAEWGVAASPNGRVIALESYKGVFVAKNVVGYTWYLGPNHAPSPIFFGDSLAEIERFLWDEIDRSPTQPAQLPFLVGEGQGGIMALAAALAAPDLLSGVIAIGATLPKVGGWNPPLAPLENLPVLLVNPGESSHASVLSGAKLEQQLADWGALPETLCDTDALNSGALQRWVGSQPIRTLIASE